MKVGRFLNCGQFGRVYEATKIDTCEIVAVKEIIDLDILDSLEHEIPALKNLHHDNIVNMKSYFMSDNRKTLSIVFEMAEMDLLKFVAQPTFDPVHIRFYAQQILCGLAYMHEMKYVHKDMKTSNILVFNGGKKLKIADFGICETLKENGRIPHEYEIVAKWYRAPELLLGCREYDCSIDIWSLAVIICEMGMRGRGSPFQGTYEIDVLFKIFWLCGTPTSTSWPLINDLLHWNDDFPKWFERELNFPSLDETMISLLKTMLVLQPGKRATAEACIVQLL